ncbi:MAG: ABC transporter substrate-binding protein [Clostridiales bacterium]|nr:ABC transporter substrate-binding protein [Clostridiales bacterium]
MKALRRTLAILMALTMILSFAACTKSDGDKESSQDLSSMTWEEITEAARGTTVAYYGWGGDDLLNEWMDNFVAPALKDQYGITLTRTGMGPDEYMPKMANEKQAGVKAGDIDVLWINGENFYNAKENGFLYGPFTSLLPNYGKYCDTKAAENTTDFAYPTDGYEAPFSRAQFVLIADTAKVDAMPQSAEALKEYVMANPGKFTYPEATDFTGSAFIRNIIYELVGYEALAACKADDPEDLEKTIKPAMDYLRDIKPYLWRNGETYPADSSQLDQLFSDGEINFTMSYSPLAAAAMIANGLYPETAQSFVLDKGTISNTSFYAIPETAPNKAGALVFINFILGADAQLSKYDPATAGYLPVVDNSKLSSEEAAAFAAVDTGKGTLKQDVLSAHMVPEVSASLVPLIEQIWRDTVLAD